MGRLSLENLRFLYSILLQFFKIEYEQVMLVYEITMILDYLCELKFITQIRGLLCDHILLSNFV